MISNLIHFPSVSYPNRPITPNHMKDFILKFVAGLAGVEHTVRCSDSKEAPESPAIERLPAKPSTSRRRAVKISSIPALTGQLARH